MNSNKSVLEEFCEWFLISEVNCTCRNEELRLAMQEYPGSCISKPIIEHSTKFIYDNRSRLYAAITVIISVVALIGNSLVIQVAWGKRKDINRYQKLIVQLALCDFVFAVVQFMISIPLFWTNKWIYGESFCKLFQSGMTLGSLLGIGFILIINIERYMGIIHPFMKINPDKIITALLSGNLLICLGTVVPLMLYVKILEDHDVCLSQWPDDGSNLAYKLYLLVVTAIPVSILAIMHIIIIKNLKGGLKQNRHRLSLNSSHYLKRLKANRRIMNILVSLVVAFAFAVFPNRIILLYLFLKPVNARNGVLYDILSFIALVSYPIHVAANPIIYSVIDVKWRNEVKTLFRKYLRCSRNLRRTTSTFSNRSISRFRKSKSTSSQASYIDDVAEAMV